MTRGATELEDALNVPAKATHRQTRQCTRRLVLRTLVRDEARNVPFRLAPMSAFLRSCHDTWI